VRLPPSDDFPDGQIIDTRRTWVTCPSTYLDNALNNGPDYLANLAIACGHDLELLKAWVSGNWQISRGAYFAAVMDNPRIRINWPTPEGWGDWKPNDWKLYLSYDHGTASPAVAYVVGKSPGGLGPAEPQAPGGRYYPAGSILLLDEYASHRPGDLGRGEGFTIPQLAVKIKELAARWRIPPKGPADDACFGDQGQKTTIAGEFSAEGVTWRKAGKGRRAPRFQRMKSMMSQAGKPDLPGFYVSSRCQYFWQTVPFLIHDPSDPEVPLKGPTDHAADSASYSLEGNAEGGGGMVHLHL
jgi:hypothetical protein